MPATCARAIASAICRNRSRSTLSSLCDRTLISTHGYFIFPATYLPVALTTSLANSVLALISIRRRFRLPLGIRQRLSLAVAIVHEPELLILDEPTSGVDPLARDQFWEFLIDLSRHQGVTIFVSTHFMNEAARCDRISLMDAGRVLATGTPRVSDQDAGRRNPRGGLHQLSPGGNGAGEYARRKKHLQWRIGSDGQGTGESIRSFSLGRLLAYAIREALELLRDPIRLSFALGGLRPC